MASAHRLHLYAVKIAALATFIIRTAGYAAANRLAANLGFRHTLPPVFGNPSMLPLPRPILGNDWNPVKFLPP